MDITNGVVPLRLFNPTDQPQTVPEALLLHGVYRWKEFPKPDNRECRQKKHLLGGRVG